MKAKIVFSRIWRTYIIVLNTVWSLLASIVSLVYIFNRYAAENAIQDVATAFVIIMMVNLTDFITRKHFMNY